MSTLSDLPIGVFDSGIGGLTVLKALRRSLPGESYVYLGDTARVPYGTKSAETVRRYALEAAQTLESHGVKALVIACNTASAVAAEELSHRWERPVFGVVGAGARAAAKVSSTGRIGVAATASTIASGAYSRALARLRPDVQVHARACPLFVPLAEDGWEDSSVAYDVAEHYLADLRASDVDTLILGCTHYPLLKGVIARVMGASIRLVDSAEETALEVAAWLREHGELRPIPPASDALQFLVTDAPDAFVQVGTRLLAQPIENIRAVQVADLALDANGALVIPRREQGDRT